MSKLKNQKINLSNFGTVEGEDLESFQKPALTPSSQPKRITSKSKKNLLPLGDIEDEISDEAARKKNQQEKISNYVAKNPIDTAKLVNSWLHEDEL